jgi:acyl phosphate:glycerol-3-phosphate acyltransferase
MEFGMWIIAVLAGYLCGGLSFTRWVSRLVDPQADLETVEVPVEGLEETYRFTAMSATTASMKLGPRVGCTIGLLDMLKAFIPVLVFRLLYPDQLYYLAASLAAVAGHNWPVYHRFKGGRGISPTYGGLFAVDWLGALVASGLGMLLGMVVFRDLVVSYLGGLWLLIPWMVIVAQRWELVLYAFLLNILFTLAMIPEIREIIRLRRLRGGKGSMENMMNMTPMGRMMLAMGRKLRLMK